jgi:hypothetical protein
MAESRKLSVHPHMIYSLIQAQAGTLGKGTLENVMNSIDARATSVTIDIDRRKIVIKDDGHGFRSVAEIEECFAVFGFPHEPGARVYGQFGIGRAQLWSFSSAVWRTNTFAMDVDIKNRGLDYELLEDQPQVDGLTIVSTFYEPMSTQDILTFTQELKELAQFAQIPVILNGEQINSDPSTMKWDFETDDAYIKLTEKSQLAVYNLGVLVRQYPSHQVGTGGIVVTKPGVGLALNMARNDILVAVCKVWARIKPYIQKKSDEKVMRKAATKLNSSELENRAKRFLSGDLSYKDVAELKLIGDITNRGHTLEGFFTQGRGNFQNSIVSISTVGSSLGDRAHTSKLAFVMHPDTLAQFGVDTLAEFKEVLFAAMDRSGAERLYRYQAFKESAIFEADLHKAVPALNEGYEILPPKDWTKHEKAVLHALGRIDHQVRVCVQAVSGDDSMQRRRQFAVGISDTAQAWTDGVGRIAFNRKLLHVAESGIGGMMKIASVLLHEYLHSDSSTGSHIHEESFYQRHHDAYIETVLPDLVFPAYRSYISYLGNSKVTPTKKLLEYLTMVENLIAEDEAAEAPPTRLAA